MISIRVPATSANLGAGFDSVGVALSLYNKVDMQLDDRLEIRSPEGLNIPADENNLIFSSAKTVFDLCGERLTGITIWERPEIPMASGLGSSSACVLAGILGANALLGEPLGLQELLDLAARLEGHPDNVAPALLGGFVAAAVDERGRVWHAKLSVPENLCFCALIPDFSLQTEKARDALPETVSRKDAVFNISRAALLAASLAAGKTENLAVATQDCLHQRVRLGLIPGGRQAADMARAAGALGVYVSGAGPTIIALTDSDEPAARITRSLAESFPGWRAVRLTADTSGAQTIGIRGTVTDYSAFI